jgi:ribonuclease BN (tRNA processing enzyme)
MVNIYNLENCPKFQLDNPSKWTIQGTSKAGERTGFLVHPLKIVLDGGVVTAIKPIAVFNTHSHCDHTLALPTIFGPRLIKIKGQEHLIGRPLYLPSMAEKPIEKLMEAAILLSDNDPTYDTNVDYSIKENIWKRQGYQPMVVKPNDKFLVPGLKNIQVEVLKAYHNTETLGYGFSTFRKKLKKEYSNKTSQQLIQLKKDRIEITEIINCFEFVFFCDSTIENLTKHDEWKQYPVIICECTGFPEMKKIDKNCPHTYLDDLEIIIKENREKQWILIHSARSITSEILMNHQNRLLSDGLNVLFIN